MIEITVNLMRWCFMMLGIKLLMQSKNNQTITLQNEIIQTIE
jgi:hypothetical protein